MTDVADVGNEEQVKVKRQKKKSSRDVEIDELRAILDTYGGRAFYWRLLSECRVYASSFSTDPLTMAHAEGQRKIGLWALGELEPLSPGIMDKMRIEAVERERK